MKKKERIHNRKVRVFNAFTKRALAIVEADDGKCGTLADASRLAETALKAIERENANHEPPDAGEADRRMADDVARIYARVKGQTTEEVV